MTEIFFIAYQFPPLNVGGTFRPLKFVKYFNNFGIKPIIFTLSPEDYDKVYSNKKSDYDLLKQIKSFDKEIIQVKTDNILSNRKNKIKTFFQIYFNITKGVEHKKWENYFFSAVNEALKKYNPKVILVTAPPFGMVDLAVKISKKTKIPLIIDMRDSLSMWVSQPYGSWFHYKLTLKKERYWFKHAQKVIAVTQQMINDWKLVHPNISDDKFELIPNGFDEDIVYDEIKINPIKDKFIIGYVGSFYYDPISRDLMFKKRKDKKFHRKLQYVPRKEDWLYRSPYFFFKTINTLLKLHPELKNKVLIKFAGAKPKWLNDMISKFNLNDNVEQYGFIPFNKVDEFMENCDALLATSVKVINGEDYCIAGKTFDYITKRKLILGFVTEGAQKQFIQSSGYGVIFNPDKENESVKKLMNIFNNGLTLTPNKEFINNFHRKELTKKLSDIIKEVQI